MGAGGAQELVSSTPIADTPSSRFGSSISGAPRSMTWVMMVCQATPSCAATRATACRFRRRQQPLGRSHHGAEAGGPRRFIRGPVHLEDVRRQTAGSRGRPAQRPVPRPKRRNSLIRCRSTNQQRCASRDHPRTKLFDDGRLSDPGLPHDEAHPAAAGAQIRQPLTEPDQLISSTHKTHTDHPTPPGNRIGHRGHLPSKHSAPCPTQGPKRPREFRYVSRVSSRATTGAMTRSQPDSTAPSCQRRPRLSRSGVVHFSQLCDCRE